jgi:hypothetical protein
MRAGRGAQVVETLLSKHKALNSNPSIPPPHQKKVNVTVFSKHISDFKDVGYSKRWLFFKVLIFFVLTVWYLKGLYLSACPKRAKDQFLKEK